MTGLRCQKQKAKVYGHWPSVLFLADRPFHLGHLEISFDICSNSQHVRLSDSRATTINLALTPILS